MFQGDIDGEVFAIGGEMVDCRPGYRRSVAVRAQLGTNPFYLTYHVTNLIVLATAVALSSAGTCGLKIQNLSALLCSKILTEACSCVLSGCHGNCTTQITDVEKLSKGAHDDPPFYNGTWNQTEEIPAERFRFSAASYAPKTAIYLFGGQGV